MNLNELNFEQILDLMARTSDIEDMVELERALDRLEQSVKYLRKTLQGRINRTKRRGSVNRDRSHLEPVK
ncbi:hypothetical protein ACFL4G_10015 [Thermodesulfobacteriota bacterium]